MATLLNEPKGRWRIQFSPGPRMKRRSIHLGKMPKKTAQTYLSHVEHLVGAALKGYPVDAETSRWLAALPDNMHTKIAKAGLTPARSDQTPSTLGPMLTAFFEGVDVKPSTRTRMEQARRALVDHFKADRTIASIDQAAAEAWRVELRKSYSTATVSRTVLYARQFFRWAKSRGAIPSNPFAEVRAGSQINPSRGVFVDRATIAKVMDAAPGPEWRLLIALSRFCGLRVPSEALALRWQDVDWEHNRLTVRSPKTEHHEGKGDRFVPIFPEVRPLLRDVFEAAPDGAERVIQCFPVDYNPNTHLRRIIKRAGVTPWPRTWHNLRASRQTELTSQFPLHTVCAWIGNTKAIAAGHYLQVTDADWQRAVGDGGDGASVQKAVQQPPAMSSIGEPKGSSGAHATAETDALPPIADDCDPPNDSQVGRGGLEPPTPAFSVPCSTN